MRQFKLINGQGQEWDLMRRDAWLHAPDGLGWGNIAETQRVGNTFLLLHSEEEQPAPAGEMMFAGYEQADEFRRFCARTPLTLGYRPRNTWRYLDVVVSLDQGEIDPSSDLLRCPINMTGTSQWYETVLVERAKQTTGPGKTYAYTYPYTYVETESGSVELHNGALPSYPRMTIVGPVLNPSWTLFVGGKQQANGRLLRRIEAGHKLIVDCNPAHLEIAEYTDDDVFVASRYADSDFATPRFFAIPPGDSSIVFAQEEIAGINAWVEVRKRV